MIVSRSNEAADPPTMNFFKTAETIFCTLQGPTNIERPFLSPVLLKNDMTRVMTVKLFWKPTIVGAKTSVASAKVLRARKFPEKVVPWSCK